MPPAARRETTTPTPESPPQAPTTGTAVEGTAAAAPADARPAVKADGEEAGGQKTADRVQTAAREAAGKVAAGGSAAVGSMRQIAMMPVTVAGAVADDVVSTVRRPDAMLFIGGVVGLAALGVLEWPVAAVAGVGVAIANGTRRARA